MGYPAADQVEDHPVAVPLVMPQALNPGDVEVIGKSWPGRHTVHRLIVLIGPLIVDGIDPERCSQKAGEILQRCLSRRHTRYPLQDALRDLEGRQTVVVAGDLSGDLNLWRCSRDRSCAAIGGDAARWQRFRRRGRLGTVDAEGQLTPNSSFA